MNNFIKNKLLNLIFINLCLLVVICACSRPDSMLVRKGQTPQQIDKDVVFRTTYYFRIFDYCVLSKRVKDRYPYKRDFDTDGELKKDPRTYTVLNDAMYRFTMSGKASTLASTIHFESGTLKSYEIDPLGSNIKYDEDKKRFKYVSEQTELQEKNAEEAIEAI